MSAWIDQFRVGQKYKLSGGGCSLDGEVVTVTNIIGNDVYYEGEDDSCRTYEHEEDHILTPHKKESLAELAPGDLFVADNPNNGEFELLGAVGEVLFYVRTDDPNQNTVYTQSIKSLESKGWKPKAVEDETVELTLKEVADKVGVDVEKLRIKE